MSDGNEGGTAGAEGKAWLTSVPESLRSHEIFGEIEKPEGVYERLIEQHGKIKEHDTKLEGMVRIPDDATGDDERNAFYTKTGRPESFDKYEFADVEMPEGKERDMALQESLRKTAFDEGVSSKALKALDRVATEHSIARDKEVDRLVNEQNEKDTNTLKNIWPGDAYQKNLERSTRTIEKIFEKINVPAELGGKEAMIKEFQTIGFLDDKENPNGTSPVLRYVMSTMFDLIGDDSFIEGLPSSGNDEEVKRTEGGIPVFKSYAGMNKEK